MPLTMLTLGKVLLASAAGYAAARWLSTPRVGEQPLKPGTNPPSARTLLTAAQPDEASWVPREGGHPGREPMEFGASDRPRG